MSLHGVWGLGVVGLAIASLVCLRLDPPRARGLTSAALAALVLQMAGGYLLLSGTPPARSHVFAPLLAAAGALALRAWGRASALLLSDLLIVAGGAVALTTGLA